MTLRSSGVSLTGKSHKDNKDSFLADDSGGLYIVADGVGTAKPSEAASAAAVAMVCRALEGPVPPDDAELRARMAQAVHLANAAVLDLGREDPRRQGLGSTLTFIQLAGTRFALGHVGDSRAYHLSREGLLQLTNDHSVAYELFLGGAIKKEWLRDHPERNVLTRALGSGGGVVPDVATGEASPGDRFLLCTDGICEELDDAELAAALGPELAPQACCARLTELSLARGCMDDMTAVVVEIA